MVFRVAVSPRWIRVEDILELGPSRQGVRLAAQARQPLPVLTGVGHPARDLLVGSHHEGVARDRDLRQAQDLDRCGRRSRADVLAPLVEQGPDPAPGRSRDHRVAHPQRSPLHQHGGHGTQPGVEVRLEHDTSRSALRRSSELLDLGQQQNLIQQLLDALAGQGRDFAVDRVPAPDFGNQPLLGHPSHRPLRVGVRSVDLVHGHNDGNVGSLGMVDGLYRLGHHAVVSRHHQNHDVGGARAPGPHRSERLVARSVYERESPAVALDLVGADVLSDPARLAVDHIGVADAIQQQGLAMVHMAHDRHYRRPKRRLVGVVGVAVDAEELAELGLLLLARIDKPDLGADLRREQLHHLVTKRLGGGDHLTVLHEEADHIGGSAVHFGTEVLGRRGPFDHHHAVRYSRMTRRVGRNVQRL